MGAGSFRVDTITLPDGTQAEVGIFTIIAVADYPIFGGVDEFLWQNKLADLNRGIYQATQGRVVVEAFLGDEGWGLGQAEFVLHQNPVSPAYATNGKFGRFGEAVHLFHAQSTSRHTMVHEFGHHVWGLGDEYTAPLLRDTIDTAATADPGNTIIPIAMAQNEAADVVGSRAVLKFGDAIERRTVTGYDPGAGTVTVSASYSGDPTTADRGLVWFQRTDGVGCSEDPSTSYCLMDSFFGGTPGAGLRVDFCKNPDHDLDEDTLHSDRYPGLACWDVIQDVMSTRFGHSLAVPEALGNTPAIAPEAEIFLLEKEARAVVALDRSGSMAEDDKIAGARFGAEHWLRSVADSSTDWLSLIWYNEEPALQLPLGQHDGSDDFDSAIAAMNQVQPAGRTNILDTLWEAREQIQARPNRAAMQSVVLLTDGIHNWPEDSSVFDVIPSFQADGIQIICVGLGGPEHIDYETLETLARETGGTVIRVDGGGTPAIQSGLDTADAILRNGKLDDGELSVAPIPKEVSEMGRKSQPPLDKFLDAMRVRSVKELMKASPSNVAVVPFHVEPGAGFAKFSTFYPEGQNLWVYLLDPDGTPVDVDAPGNRLIRSTSPFTSVKVRRPQAGRWTAIVTGAVGVAPVQTSYLAMAENPALVVGGGCSPVVEAGAAVDFWAGASYRDRLSGLRVSAEIVAPDGVRSLIDLDDSTPDDPGSGDYRGHFVPATAGAHRYAITISAPGRATLAGGMHRMLHADVKEASEADLAVKAPAFMRKITGYFDVGGRPVAKDLDARYKGVSRAPIRKRANKLIRLETKKEEAITGKMV